MGPLMQLQQETPERRTVKLHLWNAKEWGSLWVEGIIITGGAQLVGCRLGRWGRGHMILERCMVLSLASPDLLRPWR